MFVNTYTILLCLLVLLYCVVQITAIELLFDDVLDTQESLLFLLLFLLFLIMCFQIDFLTILGIT